MPEPSSSPSARPRALVGLPPLLGAVVALIAATVGLVLMAGPASAAAPVTGPTIEVLGSAATSTTAVRALTAAKAGQVVDIRLLGFAPRTAVLVSIGPAALPHLVATDAHGTAVAAAVVPKLPTDDYLVTAASRGGSASVPLHVTTGSKVRGPTVTWISSLGAAAPGAATRKATTKAAGTKPATRAAATPAASAAASSGPQPVPPAPLTSLAALPTAATASPVGGWLALAALLTLAVGGTFAALGQGLRPAPEPEIVGRHAPAPSPSPFAEALSAASTTVTDLVSSARRTAGPAAAAARRRAITAVAAARSSSGPAAAAARRQALAARATVASRSADLRRRLDERRADGADEPVGRHGR